MRRILPLLLVLAGCHRNAETAYRPAMYPYAGFGRVGCFAGASLSRGVAATGGPDDNALSRGPWLVLDSLIGIDTAWKRAGEPATFVQRGGSFESWWGNWRRITSDSIAIGEGTYPPVVWRLHVGERELRGEGIMGSDVMHNGAAAPATRWPVWLRQVPCSTVPIVAPLF
jgi:hypothetical protein